LLGTSRPPDAWPELVGTIAGSEPGRFSPEEQAALLTGLCEAARGRLGPRKSAVSSPRSATRIRPSQVDRGARQCDGAVAADPNRAVAQRGTAIGLLAFGDYDKAGEGLLVLLDRQQPQEVQAAAVRALGHQRDVRVAGALLDPQRFAAYTPALREEVLSPSSRNRSTFQACSRRLRPAPCRPARSTPCGAGNWRRTATPRSTAAPGALFGSVSGDRARVYDEYKEVANRKGDPAQGLAVFKRECASCHRLDAEGFAVGPDLFGIPQPAQGSDPVSTSSSPNHEITQGFAAYTVATTDGRVLTGLVASESPTSLTLRQPLGKEDTIPPFRHRGALGRQAVADAPGLEKNISRQEFADLLGYLKGEGDR